MIVKTLPPFTSILFFFVVVSVANAQLDSTNQSTEATAPESVQTSLLLDRNADGEVSVAAFGDSITRGVGDGFRKGEFVEVVTQPEGEAGYPLRVEKFLDLPVRNLGRPGERELDTAVVRFVNLVVGSETDLVVLSGGSNDAFVATSSSEIARIYQTLINMAKTSNIQPVLATLPPTCCDRSALNPFVTEYNMVIRDRARINDVPLADVGRGFNSSCVSTTCDLLNLPEGLHPNSEGYDVSGEIVSCCSAGNKHLYSPGAG